MLEGIVELETFIKLLMQVASSNLY